MDDDRPVNLPALEYAPADAAARRRVWARRAGVSFLLCATAVLAFTAWRYAPAFAENWAAWSEQRAWAANPAPPGVVVLDDTRSADMGHFPERAVAWDPRSGTDNTLSATAPRSPGPEAITFDAYRGRHRSDDGVDCFVTVRVGKIPAESLGNRVVIDVFTRSLASPFRRPRLLGSAYEFVTETEGGHVRVIRPDPDESDRSHLILRTQWNGQDRLYDLWITNGARTVKIERRVDHPQLSGPATVPASRID